MTLLWQRSQTDSGATQGRMLPVSEVTLPLSLVKVFLGTQSNSDLPTIQRHERTALSINYGQKGDERTEAYFT